MDNAFMQIFRPHLTANNKSRVAVIALELLSERLAEMQSIRDEYYTAEAAYEAMESELDKEELALQMLEADLTRTSRGRLKVERRGPLPPPPPTMKGPGTVEARTKEKPLDSKDNAAPSPFILLGIPADRPEDIHPLYQELLEAAGDRQLAEEYVEELEGHRDKILYDLEIELHRKRVREDQGNQISEEELQTVRSSLARAPTDAREFEARFGITITEDELEFLRDYEVASKRARKALESATETLTHLRNMCIKKGVMRKHASYHEELAIFAGSPGWSPHPLDGNMTIDPPPSNRDSTTTTTPPAPSLAHPRFPILLSNPSHVLELLTPVQALERALRLPKDEPAAALRRAECMKELGISTLMTKAENTPDFINQWLIHRLRTSPLEAELLLTVCEAAFRVVNLRRWQEEVLYYWRRDGAAAGAASTAPGEVVGGQDGGAGELGRSGFGHERGRGGGGGASMIPRSPKGGGGGGGGYLQDEMLLLLGRDGLSPWQGDNGSVMVEEGQVNSVIEGEGRVKSEEGERRHCYPARSASLVRERSVKSLN
ncbi:uncharacterized protein THITE_2108203 [Thermothielavioides terrestris NRRL 8126]|uniref:Uncharacterized protein n=1 Tax=Thermothielavioides terrestris (strain ATCC 38088 / NRRL 8126) TaxID=578455 RepID=G2QQN1_THETT|nr:uncharacterized protein THITE_2108203 [Thermothielavioides terrestris NRRL 8126]AEO63241.1 hypothetical protein THITE_2108203 [Thermothielavioides terrestris NRRL 8126]